MHFPSFLYMQTTHYVSLETDAGFSFRPESVLFFLIFWNKIRAERVSAFCKGGKHEKAQKSAGGV